MILTNYKVLIKSADKVKAVETGLLPNMGKIVLHVKAPKKVELKISTSLDGKDYIKVTSQKFEKGVAAIDLSEDILFTWLKIETHKEDTGCEVTLCHGSK
jgi:hypothetical protein